MKETAKNETRAMFVKGDMYVEGDVLQRELRLHVEGSLVVTNATYLPVELIVDRLLVIDGPRLKEYPEKLEVGMHVRVFGKEWKRGRLPSIFDDTTVVTD